MNLSLVKPNWPLPANVCSACSTRSGGASKAPYDSLNLGDHVGDELASVQANRRVFAQALGAKPVYLKQVHGWDVVSLEDQTTDGTVADACITQEKNLACTIMVADCLPVLFCNREGTLVGAAHAGWRGLCGESGIGVLEQILKRFRAFDQVERARGAIENVANDMLVWLGPCIGPAAFEVGSEVRQAFMAADDEAVQHFKPLGDEKFLADLPALARQRLAKLGISEVYGNDGSLAWCTVSNPSKFFSHRRDRVSGRFAASIWLT
jgi:polyphenol oxidase